MCFDLPLSYMIKNRFLTPPVKADIPVTCYEFFWIEEKIELYTTAEVEEILKNKKATDSFIIKNIIDITERFHRQGCDDL